MRRSLAVALYAASQLLLLASLWLGMRRCAMARRINENPNPPPPTPPPVSQTKPEPRTPRTLGPRARVDQTRIPGAPLTHAYGLTAWPRRRRSFTREERER